MRRCKQLKAILIILLCVVAAVLYGILHDQITARICVEYFTIGHPDLFGTDSPTLLGIGWGIVATWWVGLLLGTLLAFAARFGNRPKIEPRGLVSPVGKLLLIMAACALLAGVVGCLAARLHWIYLDEDLAAAVPASQHTSFLIALWMHSASYLVGFMGGLTLVVRTWQNRRSF
jgi:hypothetical protein